MAAMHTLLADLIAHKACATGVMLESVRETAPAAADPKVLDLLHHVLLANRFWLLAVRGDRFDHAEEARPADGLETLITRYERVHADEQRWMATATDADLARVLESPLIPGGRCTVAQAWLQVCLHTHGHRAQLATLVRRHGGVPPATDFIVWNAMRPDPAAEIDAS